MDRAATSETSVGTPPLLQRQVVDGLIEFAAAHGVDSQRLFALARERGVPVGEDRVITSKEDLERLLLLIDGQLDGEHQWLDFFRYRDGWNSSSTGFLMRSSATFGDALEQFVRFQGLIVWPTCRVEFHREDGLARLRLAFSLAPRTSLRILSQIVFSQIAIGGERLTGRRIPVREVRLRSSVLARPEKVRMAFGAPVRLGTQYDELVFDAGALRWTLASANPAMREFFDDHLQQTLTEHQPSRPQPIRERVRLWVSRQLGADEIGIEPAARALGLSVRTLQRRLKDEGSAMHEVVESVRQERALALLEGSMPIAEIAFRTGYTSTRAFHRAFKRWTGGTVGDFLERREHAQERPQERDAKSPRVVLGESRPPESRPPESPPALGDGSTSTSPSLRRTRRQ